MKIDQHLCKNLWYELNPRFRCAFIRHDFNSFERLNIKKMCANSVREYVVFWRNSHRLEKNYTSAGSDVRDKPIRYDIRYEYCRRARLTCGPDLVISIWPIKDSCIRFVSISCVPIAVISRRRGKSGKNTSAQDYRETNSPMISRRKGSKSNVVKIFQ